MVSIIRSPEISDQKRKLSTRRARLAASEAAKAPSGDAAAESGPGIGQASAAEENSNAMKELVEKARLAVLAQFKEEAEAARELARQRGLGEGRQAGMEEAKQSVAAEVERIRSIAAKLPQALASGIKGLEDIAVAIAFEAVCKMLGDAAVTREGVQALVREAATHAVAVERLTVRLHPADLAMLREAGALDETLPAAAAVSWAADKGIELGGCVVETEGGELDARLETQMERLRGVLAMARGTKSE